MQVFEGPLWLESFLGTPLSQFNRDQVKQVIDNELANTNPYPRAVEMTRARYELVTRFGLDYWQDEVELQDTETKKI